MKILLRNDLHKAKSINQSCTTSGITYPTFLSMVRGRWNPMAMSTLAKYLESVGFTQETLRDAKFSDVFEVQ